MVDVEAGLAEEELVLMAFLLLMAWTESKYRSVNI